MRTAFIAALVAVSLTGCIQPATVWKGATVDPAANIRVDTFGIFVKEADCVAGGLAASRIQNLPFECAEFHLK